MGETYPPAAAWGAQGASPLQPELLYICPGHFSSVTESSGHTIYTHLSHMLALWKVNVSQCSDARGDTKRARARWPQRCSACGRHAWRRGALGAIFGRLRESEVTFACSIVGELLCDVHAPWWPCA